MSDQKFPDISVGNFAMDILKDMAKDPIKALKPALKESTVQSSNAPDISHISVTDDFVSLVTEGKKVKVKPQPVTESAESRMGNLVERLSGLLSEARQLIEELSPGATTVGNIGVNMASSNKKKKKKVVEEKKPNPWAICHSSTGPEKSDKFERCVMKIKSKYGIKK
jgi:hypothetical protein